jgi:hypothetical protein
MRAWVKRTAVRETRLQPTDTNLLQRDDTARLQVLGLEHIAKCALSNLPRAREKRAHRERAKQGET